MELGKQTKLEPSLTCPLRSSNMKSIPEFPKKCMKRANIFRQSDLVWFPLSNLFSKAFWQSAQLCSSRRSACFLNDILSTRRDKISYLSRNMLSYNIHQYPSCSAVIFFPVVVEINCWQNRCIDVTMVMAQHWSSHRGTLQGDPSSEVPLSLAGLWTWILKLEASAEQEQLLD